MRSQGGVQFPTGGDGNFGCTSPRAPASVLKNLRGVSRFGVIPRPTVIVRMKETRHQRPLFCVCTKGRCGIARPGFYKRTFEQ